MNLETIGRLRAVALVCFWLDVMDDDGPLRNVLLRDFRRCRNLGYRA
jgi:hypothetical protein